MCIRDSRRSKFRIGIQFQAIFDHMAILIVPASLACADYKSTVRNSAVVTFQFLFGNKMYCGIVFIKVVRHSLDLILNPCKISAFFSYYETLSGMFLSCSKLRILSASYCFQSRLNWLSLIHI